VLLRLELSIFSSQIATLSFLPCCFFESSDFSSVKFRCIIFFSCINLPFIFLLYIFCLRNFVFKVLARTNSPPPSPLFYVDLFLTFYLTYLHCFHSQDHEIALIVKSPLSMLFCTIFSRAIYISSLHLPNSIYPIFFLFQIKKTGVKRNKIRA
jgi:hypothetical protein